MFKPSERKPRHDALIFPHDVTFVASPDTIYADGKRQLLIQKINQLCAFDASRFQTLCTRLLDCLANYYQYLPETTNRWYAQSSGLLDQALHRTDIVLTLFRDTLILDNPNILSEAQQLWMYVLFSASLLRGIAKVQLNYHVKLFDRSRSLMASWNPLLGSLYEQATSYQYEWINNNDDEEEYRRFLNVLLAQRLMPKAGFDWIASDARALATWMSLLHDDLIGSNMFVAILERADALVLASDLHHFASRRSLPFGATKPSHIGTFMDVPQETYIEKEQALGAEFIHWLQNALAKGQFSLNQMPLLMSSAGLVLFPELFQWFIREHPEYRNWQAVQKGLLRWGVHRLSASDQPISRVEDPNTKQLMDVVILERYSVVLPHEMQVKLPDGDSIMTMNVLDVMRMNNNPSEPLTHYRLSDDGIWVALESETVSVRPIRATRHE